MQLPDIMRNNSTELKVWIVEFVLCEEEGHLFVIVGGEEIFESGAFVLGFGGFGLLGEGEQLGLDGGLWWACVHGLGGGCWWGWLVEIWFGGLYYLVGLKYILCGNFICMQHIHKDHSSF
jgi:hypothetical protein